MNGTFRWCTDRLKITPSANKIKSIMRDENSEVVVLLGVRKAESIVRKRRIEGREIANRLLNRHETIPDAYVYNPIVELTTDDVWNVLLEYHNGKTPWGSDNNELVALYSDADSGECPFAGMSNSGQTQSCGQSRFGCIVRTKRIQFQTSINPESKPFLEKQPA
jgi:DNA sulfur modification protein DndC